MERHGGDGVRLSRHLSLAFWEPVVFLEEATPDPGDYHPEPEWYFLFLFPAPPVQDVCR